jgi:hypothetical protein
VSLLFPVPQQDLAAATAYVDGVAAFFVDMRTAMTQDVSYAAAVALCPQLYDIAPPQGAEHAR